MIDLVRLAFLELYKKEIDREYTLKYSKRFKAFNANVRITHNELIFNLGHKWKTVSAEMQIGLIQSLLVKVYKRPAKSMNIDLYHNFIKNVGDAIPASKVDPLLKESFDRVNAEYFFGYMETPNLGFGKATTRTLGSYNFHSNKITMSPVLRDAPVRCLDYVMYHELLHKKLQFKNNDIRTTYHSTQFRKKEKEFKDALEIEIELNRLLRQQRRKIRHWWQ